MVRPRFDFFITQDDGTIFGSAINPINNERLAYVIAPGGNVRARQEDIWHDLPREEASFVRFVVGQVYRFTRNYLTHHNVY
jgi:hypothetical protein